MNLVVQRAHQTKAPRPWPAEESQPPHTPLTAREREILRLVAAGYETDAMAAALVISPSTVRNHVVRILAKLGARNRAHAVALGAARGYLD